MQISLFNKFLYFLLSISLFIGFYYGEDSSGSGGHIADFYNTWELVLKFRHNFFMDFTNWIGIFPLHYQILSIIQSFAEDQYVLRFLYCLISVSVPYLFYICLKNKFEKEDKNLLYIFSLIIFLFPSFRSGAIWANSQTTGIIFFLLSLLFFIKWSNKKNFDAVNINLILQIAFMSLAVYTRQLYAVIFLYFVYIYYKKLKLKNFIVIGAVIFLFALPGFFLVFNFPQLLSVSFNNKFYNSLLINSSIISFYLIPIYSILVFYNKIDFSFKNKKYLLIFSAILFLVLILSYFFDYNFRNGGGFFLKLSYILFNNFYFFFLTSFIGLCLLFLISFEDRDNLILILLLLFIFTSTQIFQKYFEPMFLLVLFLILKTKLSNLFLSNFKYIYIFYVYILVYFITAVINDVYQITKSI